jgi:flagellar hook-basal body complex protein FliE
MGMIDPVTLSTAASSAFGGGVTGATATSGMGVGASTDSTGVGVSETPFASVLQSAMREMGTLEQDASNKVTGLLNGNGTDVHTAMLATERSDLAFQLTLSVRNKAVEAYTQLNSMQF